MTRLIRCGLLALLTLVFTAPGLHAADSVAIDVNALISETQQRAVGEDVVLVWWIPEDFWRATIHKGTPETAAQAEAVAEVFRPYLTLVVVDGRPTPLASVKYRSGDELRTLVNVVVARGKRFSALADDTLSADLKSFLGFLKPFLANMLGPLGENMHFLFFPANAEDGKPNADPHFEGSFRVAWDKHDFRYRLPLAAVMAPKFCPLDGERMSGNWRFCPWHGVELK